MVCSAHTRNTRKPEMMMKTIKAFAEQSHIDETLIRAVVRQAGGWDSFKEMAEDVANHGADGGFHGFIYYTDTVKFAEQNKTELNNLARSMASDLGEPGGYSLIAGFNCLKRLELNGDTVADAMMDTDHEDHTQVMNALAWFALEEVSRSYTDLMED